MTVVDHTKQSGRLFPTPVLHHRRLFNRCYSCIFVAADTVLALLTATVQHVIRLTVTTQAHYYSTAMQLLADGHLRDKTDTT